MSDINSREAVQFRRMTGMPVSRLILSMSGPTIISMLITAIYHTADAFFVSQLGTSASGAVGIVFSMMALIQAVGFTLGTGTASLISRRLGERDVDAACVFGSSAFVAALIFGALFAVFGLANLESFMLMLGSTPTILPYAAGYASIILCGAPLMCASFVMNNILRSEGKAAFSMIGLTTGGILNVILDPILIFGLDMGTSGAALATVISQCVSFSILFQFFLRKKSITRLSLRYFSCKLSTYGSIIRIGCPSLFRQGLASIATVMLNVSAAGYGDAAVAAMSIVTRVIMFMASIMIGIGHSFMPVCGYNYGAGLYSRVKGAWWFTVKFGLVMLSASAALLMIFAPEIIRAFRNDPAVIEIGTRALRWQACVLPLHAFIVGTNMMMQSTGQAFKAAYLACNRQGFFFIPAICILSGSMGLAGVEMAQACSDFLSALVAVPFALVFFRTLSKKEKAVDQSIS